MATLHISEYEDLIRDAKGAVIPVATLKAPVQSITFTASTQSAALKANTKYVRVFADAKAHLAIGASPTATVANMPIAANSAEYFGVDGGQIIAAYDGVT